MPTNRTIQIVPSILSADFARLGEQVREAEEAGADRIQVDVMDGHFVPNITMGAIVVEAVRRCTTLPLEAHLMICNPEQYIEEFAMAGADVIIVHQETSPHLHRIIQQIKAAGKMAGISLTPSTPVILVEDILALLDLVLIMTVNPGFGGHRCIPSRALARLSWWNASAVSKSPWSWASAPAAFSALARAGAQREAPGIANTASSHPRPSLK